ncbi:hypothetical protein CL621_02825 [archaeon]|nr:hypothetical protein [archaeon]
MRKLVYFLLFILILPAVNAFLDLRGIYDSNPFVFDFLVFFAIFGLIARISFGRFFGKTETTQRLLSAVVAFALAFAGVYAGLSLSAIGDFFANSPILWFLIAIVSFLGLFVFLNWIFKVAGLGKPEKPGKPWLALLLTTIISLFLYYLIFPESILRMIPFDFDFMGNVVSSLFVLFLLLVLAGLIFFGIRLLKKGSSESPRPPGKRGPPGKAGETGRQGRSGRKGRRGGKGGRGSRGELGEVGEKGKSGRRGRRGSPGEAGETGEQGRRGRSLKDLKQKYISYLWNYRNSKSERRERIKKLMNLIIKYAEEQGCSKSDFLSTKIVPKRKLKAPEELK